jgi:hypothetical protein
MIEVVAFELQKGRGAGRFMEEVVTSYGRAGESAW